MADKTIGGLTAGAVGSTIVSADLIEIEHDPSGTPASKKGTLLQAHLAANVPCVSASRTSAQTIPNTTSTMIQFDVADDYDTDTMHDPSSNNTRITAITAGVYAFTAAVQWSTAATGAGYMYFRVNGTTQLIPQLTIPNSVSTPPNECVSVHLKMAANDYMEVGVYQNSGGNLDIIAASVQAVRVAIG